LRRALKCERGGIAGLIDADFIETNCYVPIAYTLGYLYAKADVSKRSEIEEFLRKYDYYLRFGIKVLLKFTSRDLEVEGDLYSISVDNGEKALKQILDDLSRICN
jgi:hypothetical protein